MTVILGLTNASCLSKLVEARASCFDACINTESLMYNF